MKKRLLLLSGRCIVQFAVYLAMALSYTYGQVPGLQSEAKTTTAGHNNLRKLSKIHDAQARTSSEGQANLTGATLPHIKDDPQGRHEYELLILRDPATGKIPDNIRDRELDFAQGSNLMSSASGGRMMASPWKARGPYNVGGRTRAMALDLDNENIILAGGVSGGMWRSTDGGATWRKTTGSNDLQSVTAVAQDPRPGFRNIWYYTTGERIGNSASGGGAFFQGNGIYKSTDGGVSWTILPSTSSNTPQVFDNPFDLIFNIVVNPLNGDVYAATFFGIYRSTNGGNTFTEVLLGGFDTYVDVAITSTGVLYATLDNRTPADNVKTGIYRSADGVNWTEITPTSFAANFNRMVLAITPSNENIVWVIADTPGLPLNTSLWRYTYLSGNGTSSGGIWENRSGGLPNIGGSVGNFDSQGSYNLVVKVHPVNPDVVFIGGTNLYRSTNGFTTRVTATGWIGGYSPANNVSIYPNHHPDQHVLLFYPSNPNKSLSAHDGGVCVTDNILSANPGILPVTWRSLNNGYLTTQPYTVAIDPKGGNDLLIAGFQDNGTWFTTSTTLTDPWPEAFGGDGSYTTIANNGLTRYVSTQNGNVYRLNYASLNSPTETSFTRVTPTGASGFLFINPFILDENDDRIMYMPAGQRIWRNSNLDGIPLFSNATTTVNWRNLAGSAVVSGTISALATSRNPANVLYYGTTTGGIYRMTDANLGDPVAVNIAVGKGLPAGNVSSITIDPTDANRVFVVFSNYNIRSIFYTEDGGDTWTDISGNLEENPDGTGSGPSVRWLAILGYNDKYFVGTSTGLYSTDALNGDQTIWVQENPGGIGNVVVPMVKTRDDGMVAIATHGNGLYSANFEVSEIPAASLVVANPLSDIEVFSNSPKSVIDLSGVFVDRNNPDADISLEVVNTNPNLVTTTLKDNLLIIEYKKDALGTVDIGIIATSGSQRVSDVFTVTLKELLIAVYQQTGAGGATSPSQLFTDFNNALAQTADDFTVPVGETWKIDRLTVEGAVNGAPVLNRVQVVVYRDASGTPGQEVYNSGPIAPLTGTANPSFDIKLPAEVNFTEGKYWLSVYPILPFGTGNQWFWREQTVIRGSSTQFRDPANLFGRNAITWTSTATAFARAAADVTFTLLGKAEGSPTPAVPANLQVRNLSPVSHELQWSYTGIPVQGFVLERATLPITEGISAQSTGLNFEQRTIIAGNLRRYVDTDEFDPTLAYFYRLSSLGASGGTSEPTAIVITAVKPAAPKALFATNINPVRFTARWEAVAGAEYYLLDVSEDGFVTFEEDYNGKKVTGTSFAVTGLRPNPKNGVYQYRVRAVNPGGASPNSNVINVQRVQPLLLTSVCSGAPDEARVWRVRNPNPFDVSATWDGYDSGGGGQLIAPPGDSFFITPTGPGANTTILSWINDQKVRQQTVKASSSARCNTDARIAAFGSESGEVALKALKVFPNPSHGRVTIQFEDFDGSEALIQVYNSGGTLVKSIDCRSHVESYDTHTEVDLSALPKGMYFVRISSKDFSGAAKVVKQ